MARFPESFLDDLRARLKPSEVVGRHMRLKRRSGGEFVAVDDESFTVSDKKGLIHDFGKTAFDGDIFAFEMHATGCTFHTAVESLASLVGLQVPGGEHHGREAHRGRKPNGSAGRDRGDPDGGGNVDLQAKAPNQNSAARRIVARHPYHDADGSLIFEVAKIEWRDERGRHKVALPRRPVPGEPGRWAWGLKAGAYVRGRDGDFRQLTEEREQWPGDRRAFDEVAPLLYRFPELREELAQDPAERRAIFLPEGEKDADTLAAWGCCATTSPGGTGGWRPWFAQLLAGADVVIPLDNDEAGRKFAHEKALSLRGIAARVRLLDVRAHWPACPDKGDVSDWRDHGGGTAERLFEIVDRLPDWTPEPPKSAFGAVQWRNLNAPARELSWLIKKVVTRGEVSIWFGAPGSGKSFLITDAGLAIARGGLTWFGQRSHRGLVIYQAGEGGLGLKKRLRAYMRYHGLTTETPVPFVLLPSRINLWVDDKHTDALIEEIKAWAGYYDEALELVVIDTMSAASTGANENASEDVGRVLQRCHRIAGETGAHVALVHHTPKAGGSPRGWSGLTGNVESAIEILETEQSEPGTAESGNAVNRTIRQFVTRKQKDAEASLTWSFTLRQVVLGIDQDGDPDTSCVVAPTGPAAAPSRRSVPAGWVELTGNNVLLMRALAAALAGPAAVVSPPGARAPESTKCVRVSDWQASLYELAFVDTVNDPEGRRGKDRARKAVDRAFTQQFDWVKTRKLIGKYGDYVWRTDRKVVGVDPEPIADRPRPPEPDGLRAPGEGEDDLPF